jgi:hypothetical protein
MAQAPMAMQYLGSGIWFHRRTTCGAIFLVTVPDTIKRSAWRGEGRKISDPKRAMSNRAMEDAIISMAQQASPNWSGQTERLRPQSASSSRLVRRMPWRRSSARSSGVTLMGSMPLEMAAVPGPDQSLRQQQNENQHDQQSPGGQAGKGDGERQQKHNLDVKDQKDDGVELVVRLELDPRVAGGFHAAFI